MFKKIVCLILILLTSCFFSACSFNWVSIGENFGTSDNTTKQEKYSYPTPVSKPDKEPDTMPEDSLPPKSNLAESMTNILGIKVAYDATQYSKDILNDSSFFMVLTALQTELGSKKADFDLEEFVTNNSRLLVDATYISRVLWILNIINQYKMLGEMLITDLWANYGLGISNWTIVDSPFWSDYNYEQAIEPTDENKNLINFMETETTTIISLTIDGEQKDIEFVDGIASKGTPWFLNTLNGDLLVDTQTGKTMENDPEVEPQDVTVYAIYKTNGEMEYTRTAPVAPNFELDNMLIYSDYVALMLMEYYSGIAPELKYTGEALDVEIDDFLICMPDWLDNNLGLGYFYDDENVDETIEELGLMLANAIVGEQAMGLWNFIDWQSMFGILVKNYMDIKVIDYVDNNHVYCKKSNKADAYILFPKVLNVEYCDYTPSQFMSNDEVLTSLPKEKILSMVIMVNTSEQESYFNNVMFTFVSEKDVLMLETNFRYVLKGDEKANLELDYSVISQIDIGDDGDGMEYEQVGEIVGDFNGVIAVKPEQSEGEEQTNSLPMDYMNKNSYMLDSDALNEQGVDVGEDGLAVQNFENNLASNYIQHVLSIKKGHLYQVNNDTGLVNYAENGDGSDYFEFNFNMEPVINVFKPNQEYENKMMVAILNLMVEPKETE